MGQFNSVTSPKKFNSIKAWMQGRPCLFLFDTQGLSPYYFSKTKFRYPAINEILIPAPEQMAPLSGQASKKVQTTAFY